MDFFTKKELYGLKGDIKSSEIALNAEKEAFKKKLIDSYGAEIKNSFNGQEKEVENEVKKEPKKKKCILRRLFEI